MTNLATAGFGGGCHWCTESVFLSLQGVHKVDQGFIASDVPDHYFSEAVRIHFDEQIVSLETLIEIHLHTHSSTSLHQFREKYRSAIYVNDVKQQRAAQAAITTLQSGFEAPLVTQILPLVRFKWSDERYHNYYSRRKNHSFSTRFIEPKLNVLKRSYKFALKEAESP